MSVQQTLTGETTAEPRQRPDTWNWCHECEDWILRSAWLEHKDHSEAAAPEPDDSNEEGENDEPERVGGVYDIDLEYSVTYRIRVAAWSEHEAEDRAKDLVIDAQPADSFHLHTDKRQVKEVMSDDAKVPEDYDPEMGTPLWEVYGSDG